MNRKKKLKKITRANLQEPGLLPFSFCILLDDWRKNNLSPAMYVALGPFDRRTRLFSTPNCHVYDYDYLSRASAHAR